MLTYSGTLRDQVTEGSFNPRIPQITGVGYLFNPTWQPKAGSPTIDPSKNFNLTVIRLLSVIDLIRSHPYSPWVCRWSIFQHPCPDKHPPPINKQISFLKLFLGGLIALTLMPTETLHCTGHTWLSIPPSHLARCAVGSATQREKQTWAVTPHPLPSENSFSFQDLFQPQPCV